MWGGRGKGREVREPSDPREEGREGRGIGEKREGGEMKKEMEEGARWQKSNQKRDVNFEIGNRNNCLHSDFAL